MARNNLRLSSSQRSTIISSCQLNPIILIILIFKIINSGSICGQLLTLIWLCLHISMVESMIISRITNRLLQEICSPNPCIIQPFLTVKRALTSFLQPIFAVVVPCGEKFTAPIGFLDDVRYPGEMLNVSTFSNMKDFIRFCLREYLMYVNLFSFFLSLH